MPSAKYTLNKDSTKLQKLKKSWLTTTKPNTPDITPRKTSRNIYENVPLTKSPKPDVILHQTHPDHDQHVYENVQMKIDSGYDSLDENLLEQQANVTVVEVAGSRNYDTFRTKATVNDNKLKIVIDNFDKILDEYKEQNTTSTNNSTRPKLQKTKSCSIIESKCILKKTVSDPNSSKNSPPEVLTQDLERNCKSLQNDIDLIKTKSMIDLSIFVKTDKSNETTKSQTIEISDTKSPTPEINSTSSDIKSSKTEIKKNNKVAEVRKMFDTNNPIKLSTPPTKQNTSIALSTINASKMTRAKSSYDVSSKRLLTPSKIPIKSSPLNKAFSPSTPIGLNHILDRTKLGCATTNKSIMNLEQLRDTVSKVNHGINDNLRKIRSVSNDLNQTTLESHTLDKCITTGNRILKKVEQLNGVNSALQRRLTYTKHKNTTDNNNNNKRTTNNNNNTSNNNNQDSKNVTSFALLKKQSLTGLNKKSEPAIKLKDTVTKRKIHTNVVMNSVQKFEENDKKKNNIFGLKSAYMIKKQEESKKMAKKLIDTQHKLDFLLKKGKEHYEIIKFIDCSQFNDQQLLSLTNTSVNVITVDNLTQLSPESIQKPDVRDDEMLLTTFNNQNGVNGRNNNADKSFVEFVKNNYSQTDDDRCSEDSGNISNENELDCEDEEVEIPVPKRKTSSDSDESLIECNNMLDISKISDADQTMTVDVVSKDVTDDNIHSKANDDNSKIFFRPGTLAHLEAQRDSLLTGRVIHLQAHCRGYLARKRLQKRRLQETAVRCIQRNVKAFMAVRDWPWWRLLVRVTPLLNVHRTEEELKKKTEELEILRAKVEKLEAERTTLKHDNDKLEAKLSEMTADLAEEHSTATLAAERLDAETSERIRLERELSEVQNKNKTLHQTSERLEMELLYARSDINGVISEEDEEGEGDTSVYKAKYERAVRELEFTRRRLQQQHEDDLEQLVGLKKQLEKKLSDAYEEVEEQRQVVGQWKRKVQKLTSEMNDLRLLIEEQNARNNLLEKKQRKFDSETQLLQDEVRQEKQQKERLSREKDILLAEKYTLESNLADVRLELELKEERLNSLQQEYNDITFGGKSDDEVTTLRKQKQDAERRVHEQEEELDDLAGQVQMLEQAKVRLEMSLEQQRKEARREAQQRDDELEEVRCNAQKKVKALEAQLENEHEERTLLLREKHSLERRLAETAEAGRTERQGDEALLQRLKRDLRRTKALLRDAQTMLERNKADNPGKAVIRQLRNQLDDLECARAAAVKAKQTLEGELSDVQSQLDDAHRQKAEAEERANMANRERTDLRTQLEENEEELAEVLKKYRATVQQLSTEQMALQEQISINSDIEAERNNLKEQLAELTMKLEAMETLGDPSSNAQAKRMELRAKELESKLEFEQTTRARLEVQITRLKEATDKLQTDLAHARTKEAQAQDNLRKLQRSLRELREEHAVLATRENESLQKRKELEKKLESSEAETLAARADLRLALQRIDDLQAAIQGELEDTTSDHSDSDNDSYSSDESIDTFLANHKLSPTKPDRSSLHLDTSPRSNEKRLRVGTPEDSFA